MQTNSYFLCILIAGFFPSCIFFGPSKDELFAIAVKNKPYDVIIVPGVPHDTIARKWDMPLRGRLIWAKYLYDNGITRNIIFSGGAVYTPYCESEVMAMYAVQMGIPKEHIFVETKAEHSTENIYYSYYLAQKLGFEKVAVATDPFQAKLLRHYPKRMKVSMDFIPFVIDTLKIIDTADFKKINAEEKRVVEFVSLADRQDRFTRFWGTLGKHIKRDEADVRKKSTKRKQSRRG